MILIITNKLDPHADAVIGALKIKQAPFIRFNTEDFPQKISFSWTTQPQLNGELGIPHQPIVSLSQITACLYRRPAPPTVSKDLVTDQTKEFAENECNTLLQGLWSYFPIPLWVNHPSKIKIAESKIANLKVAQKIGFKIPKTLITINPKEAKAFLSQSSNLVINKVLGKGSVEYMKDYFFVYTHKVKPQDLGQLDNVIYAPTLLQEYIPKKLEVRATVVGNQVFSCEIHSQNSAKTLDDWRHYDFDNVPHFIHNLPPEISTLCLTMTKFLELNFATFDLILTPQDEYIFLELNPNGQWLWIEKLTGLPISESITDLLINTSQSLL